MNTANRNTIWASAIAEELYRSHIRTVCVSPGSRSTPLVMAFAAYQELELLVHIDERSAGFFALGLAKVTRQPVALLCTSGTAAANYYPAIIEAFYSGIPLVVLTADRPPELRNCGAGQTIDQIKMFGDHVRYFFEVGVPEISDFKLRYLRSLISHAVAIARGQGTTPAGAVHLNFAFADPLTPVPDQQEYVTSSLGWQGRDQAYTQLVLGERSLSQAAIAVLCQQILDSRQGIIVIGVYDAPTGFATVVKDLAAVIGYPLLVESTGMDRQHVIGGYDSFLRSPEFCETHIPQLVIRFGAMPTSKAYQLWLEQHINSGLQQIIVNNGNNTDPTHGGVQIINTNAVTFCQQLVAAYPDFAPLKKVESKATKWQQDFVKAEEITQIAIAKFMASTENLFDGKVYTELAQWLPEHTHLYVASSSPIRDLDSFFHNYQNIPVLVNRGANGIDGTLSSALGAAWGAEQPMVLICGDLAFYHDLNGLMAIKKYQINLTVILLNNDGGGIFDMLAIANYEPPFEEFFGTPHGLDFAPIAIAYGCEYTQITDWDHFKQAVLRSLNQSGTQILEIKSDRQQNKQLHQNFWKSLLSLMPGGIPVF